MDLIACHIHADFDCLASLLLARKLYPGAEMVFPGSQERNVREYLATLDRDLGFRRIRELDLTCVQRLILVDTRQPGRIGELQALLDRRDLRIDVFDHHPPDPTDITAHRAVVRPVGATTTLLVDRIRRRKLHLTPLEATIAALGIYEDTGSLTFVSTTPDDLRTAAWLLTRGADLRTVAEFVDRELSTEQVALLGDLIASEERLEIRGVGVALATAHRDRYVGDLAVLAHKLVDMEALEALVALVRMGDRVVLVVRSRCDEVDSREIAARFGGGGHPSAAAATLRGVTLTEARERILQALRELVRPRITADQIMTAPVQSVSEEASVQESWELLNRFSLNKVPVHREDRLTGIVSRQTLDKAMGHGLGDQPVGRFATRGGHSVPRDAEFREVEQTMLQHDLRFLPVVQGRQVVGVITRTDLLRVQQARRRWKPGVAYSGGMEFRRNLQALVSERLNRPIQRLLRMVGEEAARNGMEAYLVGGMVRDLLLGAVTEDIDVVVEGDAIRLAKILSRTLGGRTTAHRKFGTATVIAPDHPRLDLATARTEYYAAPGSLPAVERSSLRPDLNRRDFTINALALRLNPDGFGQLVDFFGGERDLRQRRIRVLHGLSFVEDPTRAFRAVRFEQRFDFQIDDQSLHFLRTALVTEAFAQLSPLRRLHEVDRILLEPDPYRVLRRLSVLELATLLFPGVRIGPALSRLLRDCGRALAWQRLQLPDSRQEPIRIYLTALCWRLKAEDLHSFLERLSLPPRRGRRLREDLAELRRLMALLPGSRGKPRGPLLLALHQAPEAVLILALGISRSEANRQWIIQALTRLRSIQPALNGQDVLAQGIPHGPMVGQALRAILEQRLLGRLESPEQELEFLRSWWGDREGD